MTFYCFLFVLRSSHLRNISIKSMLNREGANTEPCETVHNFTNAKIVNIYPNTLHRLRNYMIA